ncbi:MAG: PorP/SprF family type IX secretion system membrane protein, partial [Flavobacteriales bacterium]
MVFNRCKKCFSKVETLETADESGDLSIPNADLSENAMNGGFGLMYHTDLLYVGLSIPNLMENQWVFGSDESNAFAVMEESRHYYLNAGRAFKLNPKLILKPAVMVRYVQGAPVQTDVNASLFFNKTLWVGASYRWGDSVDFLFEYVVTRQLTIGYSFDFTLTKLQNHQGSHELFLGFDLQKKKDGFNHPRFF